MLIEAIRGFNRAQPFRRYEVQMAGGKTYVVPHPDFAFVSPGNDWVIIVDRKGVPHHLSALLIEQTSPVPDRRRPKGATRGNR